MSVAGRALVERATRWKEGDAVRETVNARITKKRVVSGTGLQFTFDRATGKWIDPIQFRIHGKSRRLLAYEIDGQWFAPGDIPIVAPEGVA